MDRDDDENDNGKIIESTPSMALLNTAEVDQQVATAHRFPRTIKGFLAEARSLATLNEAVAEACSYALPRKQYDKATRQYITKNIEGPSARFAEIVLSCWGNARAGTTILGEEGDFIVARGFMFDLQKNVALQVDVPRRIVDSNGNRYKVDMIGVTASAGASIALRNAILKVVPKALWLPIYEDARATAIGTEVTLSNKRSDALAWFQKKGVSADTLYEHLGITGIEDITLEHIATLLGYKTSLKDGMTVEELFRKDDPAGTSREKSTTSLDDIKAKATPTATPAPSPAPATDLAGTPLPKDDKPAVPDADALVDKMKKAKNQDALDVHVGWVTHENYPDAAVYQRLMDHYEARREALAK